MNRISKKLTVLMLVCFSIMFAQRDYYTGIDPASPNFISALSAKLIVRTTNSYSGFSAWARANEDAPDGNVYCVYTAQNVTNIFNREHTWCASWMPTNPSDGSSFEYADYHNLLPTLVAANSARGNYPFGKVVSGVTYDVGGSKCGKDANNRTVFEPRDPHKGDAARILMYMAVCYNGYQGSNWSIGNVTVGQNVDILLSWALQDPPDNWERAINEAVYTKQGNRNPFVDHPEWMNYINFNNLTYLPQVVTPEPTSYPTNFTVGSVTDNSIKLNWTDAVAGAQVPSGYLIQLKTLNNFVLPTDGFPVADDNDLSDGMISKNIAYSDLDTYTFTGLASGTYYYARIYSYNGTSGLINYKTDGTVPSISQQTTGIADPANFNAMLISNSQINTYWTKNTSMDPVLLAYNTTNTFGTPQNGTNYSVDQNISGGGKVIYVGSNGQFAHTGLTEATTYYYKLWSNNNNNYSAGLTANATTSGGAVTFATDLIISEYVEGSGNNKALEIFNGTGAPVNLSNYSLKKQSNGAGAYIDPIVINRTLAHNRTFVVANGEAVGITADTLITYVSPGTTTIGFNGNDAIALFKGSTKIDVVGVENDPAVWGMDLTLTRKSSIKSPSITYALADWTQSPANNFAGLGSHTMDGVNAIIDNFFSVKTTQVISNYPNPFNPSTSIKFMVNNNQDIRLNVYNVRGSKVFTQIKSCTTGQNSIKWDAGDLPAGIYLYSIEADGKMLNGKMSLIK